MNDTILDQFIKEKKLEISFHLAESTMWTNPPWTQSLARRVSPWPVNSIRIWRWENSCCISFKNVSPFPPLITKRTQSDTSTINKSFVSKNQSNELTNIYMINCLGIMIKDSCTAQCHENLWVNKCFINILSLGKKIPRRKFLLAESVHESRQFSSKY